MINENLTSRVPLPICAEENLILLKDIQCAWIVVGKLQEPPKVIKVRFLLQWTIYTFILIFEQCLDKLTLADLCDAQLFQELTSGFLSDIATPSLENVVINARYNFSESSLLIGEVALVASTEGAVA